MSNKFVPWLSTAALSTLLLVTAPAQATAEKPINVVASFSILANMTEEIGGPLVSVTSLVGPDADAHVFNPSPADARALANADVVVINGLGFEGWIDRLIKSSGFKGELAVASKGVQLLGFADEHEPHAQEQHGHDEHAHDDKHDHDHKNEHGHDHSDKHDHGDVDPHAWQDLRNGQIYAANIRDALIAVRPSHRDQINARAEQYIEAIAALDQSTRDRFEPLSPPLKRIITSHDSFGYFSKAYGVEFFAAQGWSTDSEVSAGDMAMLVREIRKDKVRAIFVENMSDPRLMQQIAQETGVRIGGKLYSDALSAPGTSADTYLKLFESNVNTILQAIEP